MPCSFPSLTKEIPMKTYLMIAIVLALSASSAALAGQDETVDLSIAPDVTAKICSAPIWKSTKAVWDGVKDARTSPEIGYQTQKGKETIKIMPTRPLAQVLDDELKGILSKCGMQFIKVSEDDDDANVLHISAEIREFRAGVEKKLVTGKGSAASSIAIFARHGGYTNTIVVGYEMEEKKIRTGNIKQMTKTLGELYSETITAIPEMKEVQEIK
jgi:hypothetical protein